MAFSLDKLEKTDERSAHRQAGNYLFAAETHGEMAGQHVRRVFRGTGGAPTGQMRRMRYNSATIFSSTRRCGRARVRPTSLAFGQQGIVGAEMSVEQVESKLRAPQ
jgi:hypothetical protein